MSKLVDQFAPMRPERKPRLTFNRKRVRQELLDIQAREAWHELQPSHFVLLHIALHKWCYSVEPVLTNSDLAKAESAARRMLAEEFNGDVAVMVDYVRWVWSDEREREQWRRTNSRGGGVLSWFDVFAARRRLTEYRVYRSRSWIA